MTFRLPTKDNPATPGKCLCTAETDSKGRLAFKVNDQCPWVAGNATPIRTWDGQTIAYVDETPVPVEEVDNGTE